jgi:hypothetical protein
VVTLWVALAALSVAATVISRPRWWTWIAPEASLAREINTALLLATAGLAYVLARRGMVDSPPGARRRLQVLALAFIGLAADERLALHERIRDRVLAPEGVRLPFVPWGETGDIVLVVVAIIGLAVLPYLVGLFRNRPMGRRWFLLACALSAVAVSLDTLPIETYRLQWEIRFQSGEELLELMAATAFVSAVVQLFEAQASSGEADRTDATTPVSDELVASSGTI